MHLPYCRNCGSVLPEGTKYCPECGQAVENTCSTAEDNSNREEKTARAFNEGKMVQLNNSSSRLHNSSSKWKKEEAKKSGSIIGAVLTIIAVIYLVLRISTIDFSGSRTTTRSTTSSTTTDAQFIPITKTIGDWEVTVQNFYYTKSVSAGLLREYRAQEGSHYCIVSLTAKNMGKEPAAFLSLIEWGDDPIARIKWGEYEFQRTVQPKSDDDFSMGQTNPMVSEKGNIAFELPNSIINSTTPPVLVIKAGNKSISFKLEKK